ncbi:MAG: DegV family protein [Christensenellaceae bacterium]|jgi:DegV family protein with EDD domain|nr:DegV family protein [Christensenellaceae bacterium]
MAALFFDSNCELFWTKARELDLTNVIPMPYTICSTEYFYDLGENYDPVWFFNLMRQGNIPISSALNPDNYKTIFEPFFKAGEDILYISFSSKLSGTFAYLDLAIKELSAEYPGVRFTRYDSKGISMSAGLQVYAAAKVYNAGKSIDEIIEMLEELTPRVNSAIIVDDLAHLRRGGRLSGIEAFLGSLRRIKPIIRLMDDGTIAPRDKVMGLNKAITMVANEIAASAKDIDKYPIVVLDADSPDEGDKLANLIKEKLPKAEIWRQPVGPVIGTHCGPGTLGVCYVDGARPKA